MNDDSGVAMLLHAFTTGRAVCRPMTLLSTLPGDLVSFLERGEQLRYDASLCEAGAVTLRPRAELVVQLFPTDVQSSDIADEDPHDGELGCYLVPAVDLIASVEGDYEATGLLAWLPCERRFGTWDSSHAFLSVFHADVTWSHIAASPAQFINAQWEGAFEDSAPTEPLVPWPRHAYSRDQVCEPLPMTGEATRKKTNKRNKKKKKKKKP